MICTVAPVCVVVVVVVFALPPVLDVVLGGSQPVSNTRGPSSAIARAVHRRTDIEGPLVIQSWYGELRLTLVGFSSFCTSASMPVRPLLSFVATSRAAIVPVES